MRSILPLCALGAVMVSAANATVARYSVTYLWPTGYKSCGMFGISGKAKIGWGYPNGSSNSHALYWAGTSSQVTDLNPASNMKSIGAGVRGTTQVGQAALLTGQYHAYLWHSTAASGMDLNPSGYSSSCAADVYGAREVGWARNSNGVQHAFAWSNSASSAIDLNPAGFANSVCNRTWAVTQVGSGTSLADGWVHPILWRGIATSATDLMPPGFSNAEANATNDTYQVGDAWGPNSYDPSHAILWKGTAASGVDLNPPGYYSSVALGLTNYRQVGYGQATITSPTHALLWSGNANSVVDLHVFLKSGYTSSDAQEIDETTGVICGEANDSQGRSWAVIWTPLVAVDPPLRAPAPPTPGF